MVDLWLSIIIINWNVRDLLLECLKSVSDQTDLDAAEIIVVDNDSSDRSVEAVKSQFPKVKLMANRENVGYGRAINQAAAESSGDFLFVLNPDTIVSEGTLKLVQDYMLANPKVGVGGCHVFYPDGSPQESFYRFPTLLNSLSRMFSLFRVVPRTKLTRGLFWDYKGDESLDKIDRVVGAAMVVRKRALEEVGGFDENYFMYSEEMDLCFRLKQKGWGVASIPGSRIIHYHERSAIQNISQLIYHRFKSEFIFFNNFYSRFDVFTFRICQYLGAFARLWYWLVFSVFARDKQMPKARARGYLTLVLTSPNYKRSLLKL